MKRVYLVICLLIIASWAMLPVGRAQQTLFVADCTGDATHDTASFNGIKTIVGATNDATIKLPYVLDPATRCKVNTLTLTANITLDNTDGSGVFVVTGQTLTVAGPRVNPIGKTMFFNVAGGQGTLVTSGRGYDSLADASHAGLTTTTTSSPVVVSNNDPKVTADQAANVASIRSLGNGPLQAMPGNAGPVFNIKSYGAVGDGVTDDTTAIQAALTAAQAARGTLYFPGTLLVGGGSYLVSGSGAQIFLVTKPIQIRGDGKYNSVVLVKSTTGATTDIFTYKPVVADLDSRGFAFRDLGVNYQSATHGRHSLVLDATNTFIAQFDIADNFFGVGAGASVVLTNPSNFVDGVFTGTIERNLMLKAPIVDRGGDTLRFVGNTISGPVGNSFDITIVSGATTFTLDGNNITCDGTSITSTGVQSALKTIIQNNIFETSQAGATGHRGALLDIAGSAAANSQLYAFAVQNNQFNSVAPAVLSGVISSYTKGLVVQGNGYVLPAGQRLLLEDHGTDTVMRDNYNLGGAGTGTEWAANGAGNNFVSVAPWRSILVSELPTSPTDTMQATVTDSNTAVWGAVVAGGGANNVRVRWNGAAWTVTGK